MNRTRLVLIGAFGAALLSGASFAVYVSRVPALLNDGMTVLFFPPILLFCSMIGVAVALIVSLFVK
jgi:hypothetical protein